QGHAHAQRSTLSPILRVQGELGFERGGQRLGRVREDGVEAVTDGLEYDPLVLLDGAPQDGSGGRRADPNAGGWLFPGLRAPLDVREEKRDRPVRKILHARCSPRSVRTRIARSEPRGNPSSRGGGSA